MKKALAIFLAILMCCAFFASNIKEEAHADGEAKTIKIGALAHETGWFNIMDLNNTYELRCLVDIINEDGGFEINGTKYMIDLVIADGQSDSEGVRSAAMLLADEGCEYVIETNDFWVIAAEDIFESQGIFHICSYSTYVDGFLGEQNPYAFTGANGAAGDYASGMSILNEYYPEVKSVVMCIDDGDHIPRLQELLKACADSYGIEVLEPVTFSGDTVDVTAIATKLKALDADALISAGSITTLGGIMKELRNAGNDMVCAVTIGQPAENLITICGEAAASNAFTLGAPTDPAENTEIVNLLKERVKEEYGEEVAANFTGNFANCLWQIIDVMKQCGSVEVEDVIAAWEQCETIETIYGTGYPCGAQTYGIANHAVENPTPVNLIVDGKAQFAGWLDVSIP